MRDQIVRDETARDHAARSAERAQSAALRIRAWLADGADPAPAGLVLTGPAAVAWACGGVAPPVDRTAATDLVWAVFTPDGSAALITTNVEADRIRDEYGPAAHGFAELMIVPWQDADAFVQAAERFAGRPAAQLGADGHPAFGGDASADLVALRLALSDAERADLADLGHDAAAALQSALAAWRPGERDLDIQARCAAALESAGADAPVLIVGGDDRLERYRHPMATGAPVRRAVMAVVVARRGGLHVAATRFAAAASATSGHGRPGAAEPAPPGAGRRGRRAVRVHAGRDLRHRAGRARGRLRPGRRARRLGRPLSGRPDRVRAAGVRDRARSGRARAGTGSRSRPGTRSPGTRACPAEPRRRTPTS